ncbi:histidine phosphatase family protein [Jeotgalibacillus sp. S-D1]|uniref:histidine phosphatase family protein n=1 Tax=Jeotgalibacillus sp. S-D1 TaxID=2552189 RepID=UPI00105A2380|nr:histidine phosphatase family protein [Jeotgalibacillus sp. S-D1]TDL30908.1 histidine phosphatase family protein [Jeotgalibacillus sp. S-D1]
MTKIGIIRHGTTEWNKLGRAQGNSNIPLDQDGRVQAMRLGARIKDENWDVIYTSPLARALETAQIIQDSAALPELHMDNRLKEIGGGKIEGTTHTERIEAWGENWASLDLGMEPTAAVIERGVAFFEDIAVKHPRESVLVVSHGSFIRHLLIELLPEFDGQIQLLNTSLSIFTIDPVWKAEFINCVLHLEEKN